MKKRLAILFAVCLAVCMCVSSFALTLDTAEAATETTVIPEEASLQAAGIVPGLNVINGKAAFETFEDYEAGAAATNISGGSVTADKALNGTKAYAAANKVGGEYNGINFTSVVCDTGRPYYFHTSSIESVNNDAADIDFIWWIMQNGASSNGVFLTVPGYKENSLAGNWTTYETVLNSKTNNPFWFQMKGTKAFAHTMYFDDMAFVPYYKITYSGTDVVEYVLFADENDKDLSKLMTAYTVKTDNLPEDRVINGVYSKCIGWSTTEGATEPMTSVELANADIELYPVWAEGDFVSVEGTYMLGKIGTTFTITASEPVEWTYDVKDTGATVATTETTLTFTAAGYAGYVTYTATSVADASKTVTAELRLIGGDKFKPGINLWTGTEEAYGFEDVDPSVIVKGTSADFRDKEFVTVSGVSFVNKPKVNDPENQAVRLTGGHPHFTTKAGTMPVVEAERPLFVSYNKMGDKNVSLPIIRNGLNVVKSILATDGIPAYLADWEHYYTTVKPAGTAVSNAGGPDPYVDNIQDVRNIVFMKNNTSLTAWLDDVMVVPYYKITYYGLDGNVAAIDYALVNSNGNFLEYYVPDLSKVAGATGFALEEGGEKVVKVALKNDDIELFAINDNVVTYVKDNTVINTVVEGDKFTFPTADVFEGGVANFRAWYVAGKNYFPGDEVDASEVIGKVIEPVAFKAKFYDPEKGVLVAYADYEQLGAKESTFAYLNTNYAASITGLAGVNGMTYRAVEAVDGENALRVHTTQSTGQWGKYRFGTYTLTVNEDAKYTVSVNAKAIEPENSGTDSVALANRFGGGFIRFAHSAGDPLDPGIGNLTTSWTTYTQAKETVNMKGSGFNVYAAEYTSDSGTPDDTSDDVKRFHLTDFYFDDYTIYCYPKNLVVFKVNPLDTDFYEHRVADVAGNYTFPTPAELGLDLPYFVAWTDGENRYEAGTEVAFADVQYKNFYAYIQDPTTPAMGFAFEGASTGSVVKTSYSEAIIDDGRTVAHLHQWGTTWDENKKTYVTDTRTHIQHAGFDASVYYIVDYAVKINDAMKAVNNKPLAEMTTADYTAVVNDKTETRIFYYTNRGDAGVNFWDSKAGEHLVGGAFSMPVNSGYNYKTIDMSVKANGNATYPWVSPVDGKVYGLVLDPNKSGTFSGDIYIDYLRVYKGGDTTVTYATNAPTGATVISDVEADTNRGLGTGYLLTGKRPAVEGYIFKGWATSADSTETVLSIDLTGDTTVYAVWDKAESNKVPATTEDYEIKGTGENNGIRFKATIKASEMTGLTEFGFIAAREVKIGDKELTFNLKENGANKKLYVSGVAYSKADGINKINGDEPDGSIIYTAVATGIPMTAKNEKMVMRTYAKYTINNMEVVVYGGTMNASLYEVAKAIAEEDGAAYANNKTYIDSILAE